MRIALLAAIAISAFANEPDGTTPLHRAAYDDDVIVAQRLARDGANVNEANAYGVTPLALACNNGSTGMVQVLLEFGADANVTLPGGETALMTAARSGNVEIVDLLLAKGADPNAAEKRRGQTALMWAASEGHADVVRALVKGGAKVDARLGSGFTAFLFAARDGRAEAVQVLLDSGADVNDRIKPLRSAGKVPKGPRADTSALMLATLSGHFELAAKLVDLGANPNAIEPGFTVLHTISHVRKPGGGDNDPPPAGSGSISSLDLVRHLVKKGADINARMTKKVNFGLTGLNTMGATPFLLAAKTADAELMRLLASLGADVKIPNADGANAVIAAAGLGTRSPGEDAGTEDEVLDAVKAALDLGLDINSVDSNGETAMHGAAYKNLPRVVDFIAQSGADIRVWNTKNRYGWTPLTIAEGYRFGNYKPSLVTVTAIVKAMRAAGVEPVSDRGAKSQSWW